MTPSPLVKHEDVPADEGMMPSLFNAEATPSMDTVDLWATPDRDTSSPMPEATPEAGEKKPKKRKSWGQVLPEPKTSLPPRKRAKTEDEKEQRRVERVLRNRRAAQSSRERKRQETEALAMRNKELEDALLMLSQRNEQLEKELKKVRPGYTPASAASPTLSQALVFTPPATKPEDEVDLEEKPRMSQGAVDLINDIIKSHQGTPNTCNPASISPALSPVAEEPEFAVVPSDAMAELDNSVAEKTADSTTRSTQYSAAVLCQDLLCQRPVESTSLSTAMSPLLSLATHFSATILSFMSLATSLRQNQASLISIILLVTNSLSTSTSSTNSSTPTTCTPATAPSTTSNPSKKTLRLKTLRKLLTSNRQLARPLQDATLAVLRFKLTRDDVAEVDAQGMPGMWIGALPLMQGWMDKMPSQERLISLLFAIRQLEARIERREQLRAQGLDLSEKIAGRKRARDEKCTLRPSGERPPTRVRRSSVSTGRN